MRFAFIEGRPDPQAVPVQGLIDAASRILPSMAEQLIRYPGLKGYLPLREIASRRFGDRQGTPLPVDNIALTGGSSQALDLISRALLRPGTTVVTEEMTYVGTLNLLRGLGAEIVGVPLDERDGMDMDALERTLARLVRQDRKPGYIYTIATNQNPMGAILTEKRRQHLLSIASNFAIPIVEDDCYGDLIVDDIQVPPALRAMDQEDSVIYVGSFSKIMGPGMRLGYFCPPDAMMNAILANRYDGGTNTLASCLLAEYLQDNLWSHIGQVNALLRVKRDTVLDALQDFLGDIATWTRPRGGLFIFIRLPEETDMAQLRALANAQEVDFTEGQKFDTQRRELKAIRLSYAHIPPQDICEGVRRLAECVRASQPHTVGQAFEPAHAG